MDGDKKPADNAPQEDSGWKYNSGSPADNFSPTIDTPVYGTQESDAVVEWTASEFVAHEKGVGWYMVLMLAAALISAGLYLLTRDVFSVVVVVIMALALAVASARKPRVVNYRVDESGLTAGSKFYPYRAFKSFVMPEDGGPFASIVLMPLKRFDFPVSAFLAPDSQDKVLDSLSKHLPMERGQLDGLEKLMRQLRF